MREPLPHPAHGKQFPEDCRFGLAVAARADCENTETAWAVGWGVRDC